MSPKMEGANGKKKQKRPLQLQGERIPKGDDSIASKNEHNRKKKEEKKKKKERPTVEESPSNADNKKQMKSPHKRQLEQDRGPNRKPKKFRGEKRRNAGQREEGRGVVAEEGGRTAAAVVMDPRFQSVHSDPRFQRVPTRQSKVAVDARFTAMFSDEKFGSSAAAVDKRGKPKKGKRVNPMLRYYMKQDNEEGDATEDSDADDLGKMKRLKALESSSSEEEERSSGSSDDSSTTSSSDEEDEDEDDRLSVGSDVAHYLMASHDDTPQIEQATHRLAAMNMDWDHIKAVDVYVVMTSCLPKDGHISSVAVYPSEFGLKCMEIEATQGPSVLIRGKGVPHDESGDGGSSGGGSDDESEDDADSADDEQENQRLRTYELNRLRYFYAVVDCDSSRTADHLYKTLDGTELLKTSNVFDLRFIPDNMEFHHPPRDIAKEIPANYKEPDFHTRALQHSNVKLSWEEDEPQRKVLQWKPKPKQLDEMMYNDYLASDDDDSEEDDETGGFPDGEIKKLKKGEKYRALLQSADGSGSDDNHEDVEITFNTGLEDVAKRALEKKDAKSETVWQAYLRKRKERRMARKRKGKGKYSSGDDDDDSDVDQEANETMDVSDDFFEESDSDTEVARKGKKDPSMVQGKTGKKHKKIHQDLDKEQEASQAELELLVANGDQSENPHRDEGKVTGKVKKKGKKQVTEDKLPKEDYHDDPRFAAMHTSHLFALDPTDPQYKRSATYARQILQKQKHENIEEEATQIERGKLQAPETANVTAEGANSNEKMLEKYRALALARSLKRKTEALKTGSKAR